MVLITRVLAHLRRVGSSWWRVLYLFWKLNPRMMLLLLVLTTLDGVFPTLGIQMTKYIVENVQLAITNQGKAEFVSQAILFGLAAGGLALIATVVFRWQRYVEAILQMHLSNKVGLLIMEKALNLDIQHFEDDKQYDTLQRASQESGYRPYQILTLMITTVTQGVTIISVAALLMTWSWWIGLLILLAPLPSLFSKIFFAREEYLIERERSPERRRLSYLRGLATDVQAIKELRLFGLEALLLQRYRRGYEGFYQIDKRLQQRNDIVQALLTLLSRGIAAGIQLYVILFVISTGNLGLLVGYLQAIVMVHDYAVSFLLYLGYLYQNNLFVSNLFEFLDIPSSQIRIGTRPFPVRLRKGIEFRDVSFSYPGTGKLVLKKVSFSIKAGECVAIVGHNGAGKTTLVKLLARLYEPTEGKIFIDDVPLEDYDLNDLRKHISIIFQDFVQYEMSVRENIGFGNLEELANDYQIQLAAQASGAAAFIEHLSEKYDSILGRMFEKGHQLSIGQWQKIAIARAFIRHAPLVVLDEPTASIDAEAEAEIFGQLRQIVQEATTFLIAHRFSTVRIADRILVLSQGEISEEGTHESLMKSQGLYAHLFLLQASSYLDV